MHKHRKTLCSCILNGGGMDLPNAKLLAALRVVDDNVFDVSSLEDDE